MGVKRKKIIVNVAKHPVRYNKDRYKSPGSTVPKYLRMYCLVIGDTTCFVASNMTT